ncbi:response regulator [Paracoccus actinidiae]|uniref:response regulator n=1 Tax=Paracoccus actinidiae TaxID=3064531 RepID=UPI0027D25C3C|nr:response regulator [Paracoccus sp. M09]
MRDHATSLFRPEALAEQQDRWLGSVLLVPRLSHSVLTMFAVLIVLGVVVLIALGEYTRKVRLSGWLSPQQGLLQVVAPQKGVLAQVLVKEGQQVTRGDVLAVLSGEQRSGNGETRQEVLRALQARRDSLLAERESHRALFARQAESQKARLAVIEAEALSLDAEFALQRERVNGHIKIYSEVGHGTTVKIYLPRNTASEDVLTDLRSLPVQGGTETVLVVEDDDEVRDTTVALLTDLGYRTLRARDAASALTVVESGAPIDLVFTDVVMPGPLRSTELARKARERLPNVAVLFTSGYTENSIVHAGRLDPGVELLPKPYSRETLARKIRHVLANQQQANAVAARHASLANGHRDGSRAASIAKALNILLVEDDDLIRLGTADMLESLGHSVAAVGTGAQALAGLSPDLDVLMTDLGLPDMNGRDLVAACRRQRPDLPVVLVTGDPAAAGEVENAIAVIKPYVEADLERALAALSDNRR